MTNKAWHEANRMAPKASREQRIAWHAAHAEACACRPVPQSLAVEVKRLQAARKGG